MTDTRNLGESWSPWARKGTETLGVNLGPNDQGKEPDKASWPDSLHRGGLKSRLGESTGGIERIGGVDYIDSEPVVDGGVLAAVPQQYMEGMQIVTQSSFRTRSEKERTDPFGLNDPDRTPQEREVLARWLSRGVKRLTHEEGNDINQVRDIFYVSYRGEDEEFLRNQKHVKSLTRYLGWLHTLPGVYSDPESQHKLTELIDSLNWPIDWERVNKMGLNQLGIEIYEHLGRLLDYGKRPVGVTAAEITELAAKFARLKTPEMTREQARKLMELWKSIEKDPSSLLEPRTRVNVKSYLDIYKTAEFMRDEEEKELEGLAERLSVGRKALLDGDASAVVGCLRRLESLAVVDRWKNVGPGEWSSVPDDLVDPDLGHGKREGGRSVVLARTGDSEDDIGEVEPGDDEAAGQLVKAERRADKYWDELYGRSESKHGDGREQVSGRLAIRLPEWKRRELGFDYERLVDYWRSPDCRVVYRFGESEHPGADELVFERPVYDKFGEKKDLARLMVPVVLFDRMLRTAGFSPVRVPEPRDEESRKELVRLMQRIDLEEETLMVRKIEVEGVPGAGVRRVELKQARREKRDINQQALAARDGIIDIFTGGQRSRGRLVDVVNVVVGPGSEVKSLSVHMEGDADDRFFRVADFKSISGVLDRPVVGGENADEIARSVRQMTVRGGNPVALRAQVRVVGLPGKKRVVVEAPEVERVELGGKVAVGEKVVDEPKAEEVAEVVAPVGLELREVALEGVEGLGKLKEFYDYLSGRGVGEPEKLVVQCVTDTHALGEGVAVDRWIQGLALVVKLPDGRERRVEVSPALLELGFGWKRWTQGRGDNRVDEGIVVDGRRIGPGVSTKETEEILGGVVVGGQRLSERVRIFVNQKMMGK